MGESLMPALLAFDAATERLHIGLAVGNDVWLHESEGGALASATLLPLLNKMLGTAGLVGSALDAIAFGRGPGAFTGIRTACAAAQGLAFGAQLPVLPIDTLLAVAVDAHDRAGTENVWVAMDARMDEIYAAHYLCTDGHWQAVVPPALYTLDALNVCWRDRPPLSVAGTAPAVFGARLKIGCARVLTDARPRAHALLACARSAWAQAGVIDPAMALPLYLRDRVALTAAERALATAGQVIT